MTATVDTPFPWGAAFAQATVSYVPFGVSENPEGVAASCLVNNGPTGGFVLPRSLFLLIVPV